MAFNLYSSLRALLFTDRVQAGTVTAIETGRVTVTLPDGSLATVRGSATVGGRVYIRAGAIEGPAPALTVVDIEV